MTDILDIYNVSRETYQKLKDYETLVLEWNSKMNLISKSSAEHIWERHILDSLQLIKFIRQEDEIMYDFGSGAGFPAIVIAIVAEQFFPNLKIYMVESIGKKAGFLVEVKKRLNLNVEVVNDRIENIKNPKADVITSRAMAALTKLFEYSKPFCSEKTRLIFPKGSSWEEEVKIANEKWKYIYSEYKSETDENGRILLISNLRRKR